MLLILLSSIAVLSLTTGDIIVINKERVILRSQPATNSQAIETIESESILHTLSEKNGWAEVRYNGVTEGWLPLWLIQSESLTSDQNIAAHMLTASPIYSEQSAESNQLTNVNADSYLIVNFESNGWVQVNYDNQYGYIPTSSVEIINREDIPDEPIEKEPTLTEDDQFSDEEIANAESTIFVRVINQAFLTAPDLYSDIIYTPEYNQRFKLIETVTDVEGNDYYLAEDENGIRGYLETRITALASDYLGHSGPTNPGSLKNATIMIDAGHGGEDSGAISFDNLTYEKDVTLQTAQILQSKLEDLGVEVIQTRLDDSFVDLDERANISNNSKVDAFISIHFDASPVSDWHGTTTYYFNEDDFSLAESINEQLELLHLPNNGVSFGNYYVLRENTRPNLLLELGYMSNSIDLENIRSEAYLNSLADSIVNGLTNYFSQ
ncbi:N-acetylmuramoyl-L-alanine amidase [Aerococcaceae bacterium WGS1372]